MCYYVWCVWRQWITWALSRCMSARGTGDAATNWTVDTGLCTTNASQKNVPGIKTSQVFTEIHFGHLAWTASLSSSCLHSDDACVFECDSLRLLINPAYFSLTTFPLNPHYACWGYRQAASRHTFCQKVYFWFSPHRECKQFSTQGINSQWFLSWKAYSRFSWCWLFVRQKVYVCVCIYACVWTIPGTATICLSSCFKLMISLQSWMSSILEKNQQIRLKNNRLY